MNKEQQELLDEVYETYWNSHPDAEKTFQYEGHNIETRRMSKDEFVDMVKTDKEYGRRWGLKIEERELSAKERWDWYRKNGGPSGEQKLVALMVYEDEEDNSHIHSWLKTWAPNVPTKLITITYNDKTIESYE
jgi:hypothetical protein